MTREVYTNSRFIEFSRSHVFVRVFQDTEAQGARLAKKFGIPGFPTLIVLNPSGREVDRIIGFTSAPELIERLKEVFQEGKPDGRISI
jgi:hypothetical protein